MPSWWVSGGSKEANLYKAAYRLWREFIARHKGGVIEGLPGSYKTTKTLLGALAFSETSVIFAVPLRQLRDELQRRISKDSVFREYRDKVVVVRAHDEVCPTLAERVKEGKRYWEALAEHLKAVKEGREGCGWKQEIRKAMEALKEKKLILTTHGIAIMLRLLAWAMKRCDIVFIFDEGDAIFTELNDEITLGDLEAVKEIAPQLYKRIIRLTVTPTKVRTERSRLFLHTKLVWQLLTNSFFLTATWPKSISYWFEKYIDKEIPVYRVKVRNQAKDTLIVLNEQLRWVKHRRWMKSLSSQLIEIAKASVERFGTIGIVSRSYEQTAMLEDLFKGAGFDVWSDRCEKEDADCVNAKPYYDTDVVILTTLGKGYRGVNLLSKRTGGDFPVIVAFYQLKAPDILHPLFINMFEDDPDDPDSELSLFIRDLVMAKNVQALFRFNRYRQRKHLLILLDKLWWNALTTYAWRYYADASVLEVSIDNVAKVAVPLIQTFNPEPTGFLGERYGETIRTQEEAPRRIEKAKRTESGIERYARRSRSASNRYGLYNGRISYTVQYNGWLCS